MGFQLEVMNSGIGSVDIISANDVDNISFITKIKMIFTD